MSLNTFLSILGNFPVCHDIHLFIVDMIHTLKIAQYIYYYSHELKPVITFKSKQSSLPYCLIKNNSKKDKTTKI